jgi:hypothetical protein
MPSTRGQRSTPPIASAGPSLARSDVQGAGPVPLRTPAFSDKPTTRAAIDTYRAVSARFTFTA